MGGGDSGSGVLYHPSPATSLESGGQDRVPIDPGPFRSPDPAPAGPRRRDDVHPDGAVRYGPVPERCAR